MTLGDHDDCLATHRNFPSNTFNTKSLASDARTFWAPLIAYSGTFRRSVDLKVNESEFNKSWVPYD